MYSKIHQLAYVGDLGKFCSFFKSNKCRINDVDCYGRSLSSIAAIAGNISILLFLVTSGCNLYQFDIFGYNTFDYLKSTINKLPIDVVHSFDMVYVYGGVSDLNIGIPAGTMLERPRLLNFPDLTSSTYVVNNISISKDHTIAVINNSVYCWGSNTCGQLASTSILKARPEPGSLFSDDNNRIITNCPQEEKDFIVAAGGQVTLCVINSNNNESKSSSFTIRGTLNGVVFPADSTLKLPLGCAPRSVVVSVAAGRSHLLAVLSNGQVLSWGSNSEGQAGTGKNMSGNGIVLTKTLNSSSSGQPIKVFCWGNSSALITDNGIAFVWGSIGSEGSTLWVPSKVRQAKRAPFAIGSGGERRMIVGQGPVVSDIAIGSMGVFFLFSDGQVARMQIVGESNSSPEFGTGLLLHGLRAASLSSGGAGTWIVTPTALLVRIVNSTKNSDGDGSFPVSPLLMETAIARGQKRTQRGGLTLLYETGVCANVRKVFVGNSHILLVCKVNIPAVSEDSQTAANVFQLAQWRGAATKNQWENVTRVGANNITHALVESFADCERYPGRIPRFPIRSSNEENDTFNDSAVWSDIQVTDENLFKSIMQLEGEMRRENRTGAARSLWTCVNRLLNNVASNASGGGIDVNYNLPHSVAENDENSVEMKSLARHIVENEVENCCPFLPAVHAHAASKMSDMDVVEFTEPEIQPLSLQELAERRISKQLTITSFYNQLQHAVTLQAPILFNQCIRFMALNLSALLSSPNNEKFLKFMNGISPLSTSSKYRAVTANNGDACWTHIRDVTVLGLNLMFSPPVNPFTCPPSMALRRDLLEKIENANSCMYGWRQAEFIEKYLSQSCGRVPAWYNEDAEQVDELETVREPAHVHIETGSEPDPENDGDSDIEFGERLSLYTVNILPSSITCPVVKSAAIPAAWRLSVHDDVLSNELSRRFFVRPLHPTPNISEADINDNVRSLRKLCTCYHTLRSMNEKYLSFAIPITPKAISSATTPSKPPLASPVLPLPVSLSLPPPANPTPPTSTELPSPWCNPLPPPVSLVSPGFTWQGVKNTPYTLPESARAALSAGQVTSSEEAQQREEYEMKRKALLGKQVGGLKIKSLSVDQELLLSIEPQQQQCHSNRLAFALPDKNVKPSSCSYLLDHLLEEHSGCSLSATSSTQQHVSRGGKQPRKSQRDLLVSLDNKPSDPANSASTSRWLSTELATSPPLTSTAVPCEDDEPRTVSEILETARKERELIKESLRVSGVKATSKIVGKLEDQSSLFLNSKHWASSDNSDQSILTKMSRTMAGKQLTAHIVDQSQSNTSVKSCNSVAFAHRPGGGKQHGRVSIEVLREEAEAEKRMQEEKLKRDTERAQEEAEMASIMKEIRDAEELEAVRLVQEFEKAEQEALKRILNEGEGNENLSGGYNRNHTRRSGRNKSDTTGPLSVVVDEKKKAVSQSNQKLMKITNTKNKMKTSGEVQLESQASAKDDNKKNIRPTIPNGKQNPNRLSADKPITSMDAKAVPFTPSIIL